MSHLLHVDLLQQSADVDTLDQQHNLLLQLLVVLFVLLVFLDDGGVLLRDDLLLLAESFLLRLKLGKTQLLLDDILLVSKLLRCHLFRVLLSQLHSLLGRDFQIKHSLALFLFFLELFEHDLGMLTLCLQRVVQLHCHFSFSLEVLGLLVSISDATALNLVL